MTSKHISSSASHGAGSPLSADPGPHAPLAPLGWKPFFQQQLTVEEWETCDPVRVMAVHRNRLEVAGENGDLDVPITPTLLRSSIEDRPTVGDWLLLAKDDGRVVRRLERASCFQRMAPRGQQIQLIAANVDCVFIMSSCNADFNLARIERFSALAHESGCPACLVLTKADECADPSPYIDAARSLRDLPLVLVNARDPASLSDLYPWCQPGETIAMLGSSGVGKSTLLNSLAEATVADTGAIREDDAKGRHTTRHRSLHRLPGGALLLDSPGMRELGLSQAPQGLAETFDDIDTLAQGCRFGDCSHHNEPGCAVRQAIDAGELPLRRLHSWEKLRREAAHNDRTVAARRAGDRALGKHIRQVMRTSRKYDTD